MQTDSIIIYHKYYLIPIIWGGSAADIVVHALNCLYYGNIYRLRVFIHILTFPTIVMRHIEKIPRLCVKLVSLSLQVSWKEMFLELVAVGGIGCEGTTCNIMLTWIIQCSSKGFYRQALTFYFIMDEKVRPI